MADATNLEKKYIYRISRAGVYLGTLKNVTSDFNLTQDINTAMSPMTITVGDTADKQFEAPEATLTEEGYPLLTEDGVAMLTERQPDIVGNTNSLALIRNNNSVAVYEVSPNYPNGKLVFSGWISRWKASFGGSDTITISCLSNGSELDNYMVEGVRTLDQSQATNNATYSIQTTSGKFASYNRVGQLFQVGAGTNLAAIAVSLEGAAIPVNVTLSVYPSVYDASNGTNLMGQVTKSVSGVGGAALEEVFAFTTPISVTPGVQYFFTLTVDTSSIPVDYKNSDVYANGGMYVAAYSASSGTGGSTYNVTPYDTVATASDLYFKTYYSADATSSVFSAQDPTAILRSIIDTYVSRGGTINYASGSTVLTGTSQSYTFKVNTLLEGIKKCLDLAPANWYWYVDPATNIIYFKQTSTTADLYMVYGRHIQALDIEATVENSKNKVLFTGGDTGSNVYLYTTQTAAAALVTNAGRVSLARLVDNRVLLSDTADALMQNYLDENSAEKYNTTITINADTYDLTLLNPGQTIGFKSFGNFIDNLILRIVRIERHSDYAVLTLGDLPRRGSIQVEEIERALAAAQTIYNPTAPS